MHNLFINGNTLLDYQRGVKMCKKSFDWIITIVLVLLSSIFLSCLCVELGFWIIALPQPTIVDYVLFGVFEIEFIFIIVYGLRLLFRWKESLGYEKLVVIIAYAAFLSVGMATYFKFLPDVPNSDWISGFFLSISAGLITGLVIYFITNKRRQNEREMEDDVKILQEIRESYNDICLHLYFEQMNRNPGVEYINSIGEFPDLMNIFMTNIDKLSYSNLLQIMTTKHPMKRDDSEKQAVLDIISKFPHRVNYYIETYSKTANSEEIKNLRDKFIQELSILDTFINTKLDESQKALNRIKYSMF